MAFPSVVLVVLDGWGMGPTWGGNAISQATSPAIDSLGKYPTARLAASGVAVGLAPGETGNSKVGHINLGAGRIVQQDSTLISQAIADQSFFDHPVLRQKMEMIRVHGGRLHLIGLLSRATVHSNRIHLDAILEVCRREKIPDIRIHVITDGRDSDPRDGLGQILDLERDLAKTPGARIQSVMGRYFGMDRDQHWDRTALAYQAIARGGGPTAASARMAVTQAYSQGTTDEFIIPQVITTPDAPYQGVENHDVLLFWNFRADRMRQIVRSLAEPQFQEFPRPEQVPDLHVATLTNYSAEEPIVGIEPIIQPAPIPQTLAEVVSRSGGHQFHVAETEKYAHVTYFFNGGQETAFPGEERLLVPSVLVPTFDQAPEMSASKITDALLERVGKDSYRLLVANYANADMVGHTGNFQAALLAVEAIDRELARLIAACQKAHVPLVITADHGNVEEMVNPRTGEPATKHTDNPVPCHILAPDGWRLTRPDGVLADVAPTVLHLLEIPQPHEMTGQSLIEKT